MIVGVGGLGGLGGVWVGRLVVVKLQEDDGGRRWPCVVVSILTAGGIGHVVCGVYV